MDIAAEKNDLHMQAASPQGVKKQSWAHRVYWKLQKKWYETQLLHATATSIDMISRCFFGKFST